MTTLNGSSGDDILTGGIANDQITGNGGNDTLTGYDGADDIAGGTGSDFIDGGDGSDILYSSDRSPAYGFPYYGNFYTPPVLDSGTEVDTLLGGAGSDTIFVGYGDNADGGADVDVLFVSFLGAPAGVSFDFRLASQVIGGGTIANFEALAWVQGSQYDDYFNLKTAGPTSAVVTGSAAFGGAGNDHIVAGAATGVLYGEDGDDVLDGRDDNYLQRVDGGAGDDTLYTDSNTFAVAYGGDGDDVIYSHGETHGGSGNDLIQLQWTHYAGAVNGDDGDDTINAVALGNPNGGGNVIAGGNGADTLTGGQNNDILVSGNFADFIGTPASDDRLDRDKLFGNDGDDQLFAGIGDDVNGGYGNDSLFLSLAGATSGVTADFSGFNSAWFLYEGGLISSVETLARITGSAFNDTMTLGTFANLVTVYGGDGNDVVTGAGSSVEFFGGSGSDGLNSGAAGDRFDGGDGIDSVSYLSFSTGVTIDLGTFAGSEGFGSGGDVLINVENATGTPFNDTIRGSDSSNALFGGSGNDIIDGRGGADRMLGGSGDDVYFVDNPLDFVDEWLGSGFDTINTSVSWNLDINSGIEVVNAIGVTSVNLTGDFHDNILNGNDSANVLKGSGGHDILTGGGGDDILDGGSDADQMSGGIGNDIYYADSFGPPGAHADVIIENPDEGTDTVRASVSYTLGANIENLSLIEATMAADGCGNALDNVIYGNSGNNLLQGLGGGDHIYGNDGRDIIEGGAGRDTISGGAGMDTYKGTASELNGDTVTDLAVGDHFLFTDLSLSNFNFMLSGSTLSFTGGSLTLENSPSGKFLALAAVGGGVELWFEPPTMAVHNDFNGDGKSDLLWRHNDGSIGTWLTAGSGFEGAASGLVGNEWVLSGADDFNGDGRVDIIWRHENGNFGVWNSIGSSFVGGPSGGIDNSWALSGTGDFNGDGNADILWRHTSGVFGVWNSTGSNFVGGAAGGISTDWAIAGIGDFNGDQKDDILWRHTSGVFGVWNSTGAGFVGGAAGGIGLDWSVAGTGDFNADGKDDILWRNKDGAFGVWNSTGTDFAGGAAGALSPDWQVAGVGDFNGDRKADILWRNGNGAFGEWLNTNGGFEGGAGGVLSSSWRLV